MPNLTSFIVSLFAVVLLFNSTGNSQAHDILLLPERFKISRGDTLVVHHIAGVDLERELKQPDTALELPFLHGMTPRFELITRNDTIDLLRELPDRRTRPIVKPVLERAMDFVGPALIVMDHDLIYTRHTTDEFLYYLEHENFDKAKFQRHMGSRPDQSEAYARSLKMLFQVGESGKTATSDLHKKVLGQKLEILLLQDPYRLDPGADLDVQVLLGGEPLADQVINAHNSDGSGAVMKSVIRTNANGVARLSLNRGGLWLIGLVHLQPCSKHFNVDCSDADWESYWASYTFQLD